MSNRQWGGGPGNEDHAQAQGVLNLFAALNVGTGQVKIQITEEKERADFQRRLEGVAVQPSDSEIYMILENKLRRLVNRRLHTPASV